MTPPVLGPVVSYLPFVRKLFAAHYETFDF